MAVRRVFIRVEGDFLRTSIEWNFLVEDQTRLPRMKLFHPIGTTNCERHEWGTNYWRDWRREGAVWKRGPHLYFTCGRREQKSKRSHKKSYISGCIWRQCMGVVIPLLSVNKLINTYSVYNVWVTYVTGRVTVYGLFDNLLFLRDIQYYSFAQGWKWWLVFVISL